MQIPSGDNQSLVLWFRLFTFSMKNFLYTALALFLVLVVWFSLVVVFYLSTPLSSREEIKIVNIPPKTNFKEVVRILEKEGIIEEKKKFFLLAVCLRVSARIKAGEYQFNSSMLPLELIEKLVKGRGIQHRLTIPEGYNLFQIIRLIEKEGFGQRENFEKLAFDPSFLESVGIPGKSLEGFIFPDTYKFVRGVGEEKILREMVKNRLKSRIPRKNSGLLR